MTALGSTAEANAVAPYVPRIVEHWLVTDPQARHRRVEGSLVFVDISGFTTLTERLARLGRAGAEEMSDAINETFAHLLEVAYEDGASLVKWGGDAVLLLFDGIEHEARACRAAHRMRATLRRVGRISTGAGGVTLRMSVGVNSGPIDFFLVGDPQHHRELLVAGPTVTTTVRLESAANAGRIVIGERTSRAIARRCIGAPVAEGVLLRSAPSPDHQAAPLRSGDHDPAIIGTIPTLLRERILAGAGMPEHRLIAVAFVRFRGTDALLEQEGPQALADALDECITVVQHATAAYGVTFFETDIDANGGKIMLTAGAPSAVEHPEERMLLAARRIVEHAGRLHVTVGVNRGPVFSGDFGPPFRRTFSVKGDAVNLAARVMGKASPGQAIATRATLERSRTRFVEEPLEPFTVKGKRARITASVVGKPVIHRTAETGGLVGRDEALRMLVEGIDRSREGAGGAAVVAGPLGIGKSRLVDEVVRSAPGVRVLRVVPGTYDTATPYAAARMLLAQSLDLPDDASAERLVRRLRALLRSARPSLLPWVPAIGPLVGRPIADTPETAQVDERFRKSRLEEVVVEACAALLTTPTLVIVEDAHLMDDASADLVDRFVGDAFRRPWCVVVVRRDAQGGLDPSSRSGVPRIDLEPLTDADAAALVVERLGDEGRLAPAVVESIVQRAQGNPYFLRAMVDAVVASPGMARATDLPESLESMIGSQIDQLPVDDRAVLRCAAVLGTTFSEESLLRVLDAAGLTVEPGTLDRLDRFLSREGDGSWRFDHVLVRDAAYTGLPARRRRALHAAAASDLLAVHDDPSDVAALLSLHCWAAGALQEAWDYSVLAGRKATSSYAYPSAAELLARATGAGRLLRTVDELELAAVWEELGDAQAHIGALDDARTAYARARALHPDAVARAALLRKTAVLDQRSGRLTAALRSLSRALRLTDDAGAAAAAAAERARTACAYARCREFQGRYREAVRWAADAERTARACGDQRALAEAYEALHSASSMAGFVQDRPYGRLALALFEELGDREGMSRALNNLGVLAWFEGRGAEALDLFEQSRAAALQAGDSLGAAATAHNIGDVLLRQGRAEDAERVLEPLVPLFRGWDNDEYVASCRRWMGLARARRGDIAAGRSLVHEARAVYERLRLDAELVETDAVLAEIDLLDARPHAAGERASRALAQAQEIDAGYLVPWLQRIQGAALLTEGRRAEAVVMLETALAGCQGEGAAEAGPVLLLLAEAVEPEDPALAGQHRLIGQAALERLGHVPVPS